MLQNLGMKNAAGNLCFLPFFCSLPFQGADPHLNTTVFAPKSSKKTGSILGRIKPSFGRERIITELKLGSSL
jgi:hypothetical protein